MALILINIFRNFEALYNSDCCSFDIFCKNLWSVCTGIGAMISNKNIAVCVLKKLMD